jgi:hypothetical protein
VGLLRTVPVSMRLASGKLLSSLKAVRFGKIGLRLTKFSLAFVGEAAVVVGISITGVQMDRLGEVADCLIAVLGVQVRDPAVDVSQSVIRIQTNCIIVMPIA